MGQFKNWMGAFRFKTLPLAISSILLGNFYAYSINKLDVTILGLSLLTAILLQILSNLANDYGDFVKGTDTLAMRSDRAMASGKISKKNMQIALVITTLLTLSSGIGLLIEAFCGKDSNLFFTFLGIGVLAIIAAFTYTIGKKAYGYLALGDGVVFIFFGPVAVYGAYYMQHQFIDDTIVNLSLYGGLICTAVLNINNTRDIESDLKSNKITIANKLGRTNVFAYHFTLILLATVFFIMSAVHLEAVIKSSFVLVFFMVFILSRHLFMFKSIKPNNKDSYNNQLKMLSLSYLLFTLLLWALTLL